MRKLKILAVKDVFLLRQKSEIWSFRICLVHSFSGSGGADGSVLARGAGGCAACARARASA